MMVSPCGALAFIEVPKTGSSACAVHLRDKGKWRQGTYPGMLRSRHAPLVRDMLPEGVTTCGVYRNPWDRMGSIYRAYAKPTESLWSFMIGRPILFSPKINMKTCEQTTWLAHTVYQLRYEELAAEWGWMASEVLGIPKGPIAEHNVTPNQDPVEWDQRCLDTIGRRFGRDIAAWGYTGPTVC